LLERVVHLFALRAAAARCSLMLVDQARGELYVRKSVGLPDTAPRAPVPLGIGFAGRVAKTGLPLLVADIGRLRGGDADAAQVQSGAYRTSSCLLLPLR